jgi:Protein of unknown function (DUF3179)
MRRIVRHPPSAASSQFTRKVRAFPRCSAPVGDGANRVIRMAGFYRAHLAGADPVLCYSQVPDLADGLSDDGGDGPPASGAIGVFFRCATLLLGLLAATFTAYGVDPYWGGFHHGLEVILIARRLQMPLIAMTLISGGIITGMVAGGRWKAAWLIGLMPIMTLLLHRFISDPIQNLHVDDEAAFVTAGDATFVGGSDEVVGLTFDDQAYAYPYNVLFENPVVVHASPPQKLVLLWSAYANRAVALTADWTVKPRELEIVSMPANALLVYNSRVGQFINGITGLMPDGRKATGFESQIATEKMTWKAWRQLHPGTLVLQPPADWRGIGPTGPIAPRYRMPIVDGPAVAPGTMVAMIQTPEPIVVDETAVRDRPLNLGAGENPLLVFRDSTGQMRVFRRQVDGDLTPRFFPADEISDAHPAEAMLTELDSKSWWTDDGRAIAGSLKGTKLKPVDVDEGVYLDVMRVWYPDLTIVRPTSQDEGRGPRAEIQPAIRRAARHKSRTARHRPVAVTVSL